MPAARTSTSPTTAPAAWPAAARDGGAEQVTFSYDAAGRVSRRTRSAAPASSSSTTAGCWSRPRTRWATPCTWRFDDATTWSQIIDPAGRSTSYGYDTRGNLIRSTDALGQHDAFCLHRRVQPLASVTDAKGNPTRYAYDSQGNLQSITYADGSRESGPTTIRAIRRPGPTAAGSHPIGYTYDADGRITQKTYADGSHVDYTYDARGNLTQHRRSHRHDHVHATTPTTT